MDPESPENILLAEARDVEKALGSNDRPMEEKGEDYHDDEQGW